MNAIDKAIVYYEKHARHGKYTLHEDIERCVNDSTGICVCTPELFVLAWPVSSDSSVSAWRLHADTGSCDAWYIHLLCGNLKTAMELLPKFVEPRRYIVFQRGTRSEKVHKISWNRLLKRGL